MHKQNIMQTEYSVTISLGQKKTRTNICSWWQAVLSHIDMYMFEITGEHMQTQKGNAYKKNISINQCVCILQTL